MSYTVIARRYRPQTFDQVVGQEYIVTTLKNAITDNKVSHAYLFAGSRGVGKTSMARIFSKALNCKSGSTPTPCNKCEICRSISEGVDPDVIEMDAASNRGIDEIRTLRESVGYIPLRARYKIYIIDEAHQLTREAFNALLKTLEEPPPHVKFIFATTEPHKLPDTIVSRCQRFGFRRITSRNIFMRLKQICQKEKVSADEAALSSIAQSAHGSMRDAESLLDQLISFTGGKISTKDLETLIGATTQDEIFRLVDFIADANLPEIIRTIDNIFARGKDIGSFLERLIEHIWRLILFSLGSKTTELINEEIIQDRERYQVQANRFNRNILMEYMNSLSEAGRKLKETANPRILIELTLLKFASVESVKSQPQPEANGPLVQETDPTPADVISVDPVRSNPEPETVQGAPNPRRGTANGAEAVNQPIPTQGVRIDKPPDELAEEEAPYTAEEFKDLWPKIVERVREKSAKVHALLRESRFIKADTEEVVVGFAKRYNFHRSLLEDIVRKKVVEECIEEISGKKLPLSTTIIAEEEPVERSLIDEEKNDRSRDDVLRNNSGQIPFARPSGSSETAEDKSALINELLKNSVIQKTLTEFDGKIIEVEGK